MKSGEWRFSAKLAWQNPFVRWGTVVSFSGWLGMTILTLWRLIPYGLQTNVLVLHYTIYLGIDEVRTWTWIFLFPAAMFLVLLGNFAFATWVFRRDGLAAKTLTGCSLLMMFLWSVSMFYLISVNM